MGSIGAPEVLVVLVLALIVLGPNRLPGAARSVGRAFRELRRVTSGFQDELRGSLDPEPMHPEPLWPEREVPTATATPAETWVSTEEPASMSAPGAAAAPRADDDEGRTGPESGQGS